MNPRMSASRRSPKGLRFNFRQHGTGTLVVLANAVGEDTTKSVVLPQPIMDVLRAWDVWQSGAKIQDAFPTLPSDLREFLMTGLTPDAWVALFGDGA